MERDGERQRGRERERGGRGDMGMEETFMRPSCCVCLPHAADQLGQLPEAESG